MAKAKKKSQVQKLLEASQSDLASELLKQDALTAVESDDRVRLLLQENRTLRNQLLQCNTKTEIVLSQVRTAFGDRPIIVDVPKAPAKDTRKIRTEIPVFCLGDWHMGHYYPHGPYKYNLEICKARVVSAVQKFMATVEDRRNSAKIEELHLYLIGDMVEGEHMRPGHSHSVEVPLIAQAITHAPEALAGAILTLMGGFKKIKIVAVPGNHGRNGPPRSDAHPATNWDRVCFQTSRLIVEKSIDQTAKKGSLCELEWDLPSDRYESAEGDDWFAIDYVFDWCNCLLHGEDLKGKSWGGIPFYGVEKMVRRYADIVSDPIDFMYMGHIHVDASIPANFREVFINGAIESSSTYVRKELMSGSWPSQSAVFYSEEYGPISRHKFYLSEQLPTGQRTVKALQRRNKLKV
jgi:hypothetical protein